MIYGLPEVKNGYIVKSLESVYHSMNIPAPTTNIDLYRIDKKQEGKYVASDLSARTAGMLTMRWFTVRDSKVLSTPQQCIWDRTGQWNSAWNTVHK
jgi:hypothetical protein